MGGCRIRSSRVRGFGHVDAYNLTNANTVTAVRTNTGTASIRVDGNPANPPVNINAFLSPTGVLAPRVFRFNISYEFGGR